jgi:hypothetical protein
MPDTDFLSEISKITGAKAPQAPRGDALRKAAETLGIDPADLGGIISFETGGTFDPHKVGGEGNRYRGLIQFGPTEQSKYYRPDDTFESQLMNGVVPYFQERFKRVGKTTQGASLEDLYTTVLAGNPTANRNARDAFGTSALSGVQKIRKEHRPQVEKELGYAEGPSFIDEVGSITKSQPQSDFLSEISGITGTSPTFPTTARPPIVPPDVFSGQKPLPEAPQTIQAQVTSVRDEGSPKAAVLLTDEAQLNQLKPITIAGFRKVKTPRGTLLINPAKAKALGIKNYLKPNDDEIARLIGKVETDIDTSKGSALITTDANGNELSATKVNSPQAAQAQAEVDKASFPQAANQQVVDAEDVLRKRIQTLGGVENDMTPPQVEQQSKTISELSPPTRPTKLPQAAQVKKLVPKRAYSEADFKAWADFNKVPMTPETRKSFEGELSASKDFGKVGVSVNPSDFQVDGTPVTQLTPVGRVQQPRVVGKPTDDLSGIAGTIVPEATDATEAYREALTKVGAKYDITPQEVDAFIAQKTNPLFREGEFTPGSQIQVPLSVLQEIGGNKVQEREQMEQSQNYHPVPNLSIDKEMDEVRSKIAADTVGSLHPLLYFLPDDTKAQLASGLIGSSGEILRTASGLADYLSPLADSNARIFEGITGKNSENLKLGNMVRELAKGQEAAASRIGPQDNSWNTLIVKSIGATPLTLAKYALLTKLPGGIIVGMGADSALQAKGRQKPEAEVLKEAAKGALLGSVLHFAPLGGVVTAYGTHRVLPIAAGELIGTAGTAFAGSYAVSKAFGDKEEQAVGGALMNTLFVLAGRGVSLLGKTIRATGKNGSKVDVYVDPEGNVKLLKGNVLKNPEVEVDLTNADTSAYQRGELQSPKLPRLGESNVDRYQPQGEVPETRALSAPPTRGNPLEQPGPSETPIEAPESSIEAQRIDAPDATAVKALQTDTRVQAILKNLEVGKTYTTEEVRAIVNKNSGKRFNQNAIDQALLNLYGAQALETLPNNRVRLLTDSEVKPKDIHELAKSYGQQPQTTAEAQVNATAKPEASASAPSQSASLEASTVLLETKPTASVPKKVEPPETKPAPVEYVPPTTTAEAARTAGKREVEGITYRRQPEIKEAPTGRKGRLRFADAEPDVPFEYKLIEAGMLQPAHLGGAPNPEHFLPEAQPKNRKDTASKLASDRIAQSPDLAQVADSPNAFSGAPVINSRGEVIQGNNRSEGLRKHYRQNGTSYKQQLERDADRFGFTPEQVRGMNAPVLVRAIPSDDDSAIRLGNYTMSDLESGGQQRINPLSTAVRIPHAEKFKMVDDIFRDAPEDTTLTQLIRDNRGLIQTHLDPYLTDTQKQTLLNANKEFTPEAVKDIESVFKHFLFDKGDEELPDLFEGLPSVVQQGITASLPKIFSTPQAESIIPELQNAIIAATRFRESGNPDYETWKRQPDMISGQPAPMDIYTPAELVLSKELSDAKTQKAVKDIFSKYAKVINGTEGDLFEGPTEGRSKADAIREVFGVEYVQRKPTTVTAPVAERESAGSRETPDEEARSEVPEKRPEPQTINRPTLHGVPPQELTPVLQARVLYAKERGMTPSDIAERYNLTPEQVESVGDLPKVGSGGQMSHKLIQMMTPAKDATDIERAEKVAIVNDLAAELGLNNVRLERSASPNESKTASDAIRLAIAAEMGKERASQMSPEDWMKWLDAHGDRLSYDSIAGILDAFDHQLDHAKNKVDPFIADKNLERIVTELDNRFGLGNIARYRDLPVASRVTIEKLGYTYGLKRTAIQQAFSQTFLDLAAQKSAQARYGQTSETDTPARAQEPPQERLRQSEELDNGVQFTNFAKKDIGKKIRALKGLPGLQNTARFTVDRGVLLAENPAAAALMNQIIDASQKQDTDLIAGGAYAPPDATQDILRAALAYPKIYKDIENAVDRNHKDLTFAVGFGGKFARFARQEEESHREDYRSQITQIKPYIDSQPYNKAVTFLKDNGYGDKSDVYIHNEVIAKLNRDDARKALGLTEDELNDLTDFHYERVLEAGFTPEDVKGYKGISRKATEFAENVERKYIERNPEGFERERDGSIRSGSGSDAEIREARHQENARTAGRDSDRLARLRQADLAGQSEGVRQGQRDSGSTTELTLSDRTWIEKRVPENLQKQVKDEVQFARITAPKTKDAILGALRSAKTVAVDLLNAPRALKASADLSAAGRQGIILIPGNPIIAARAFAKQLSMLPPVKGAKAYEKFKRDLDLHPYIELAEESNLHLSSLHGDQMSKREEAFTSQILGNDPYFRKHTLEAVRKGLTFHVRVAERAYVSFLDSMRINTFAKMAKQVHEYNVRNGELDKPEQYEGIARFINYATGRGDLGRFDDASPVLATIFFSPRFWASRLQVMNPAFYAKLPPGARGLAIKNLAAFVATFGVVAALLKAAGFQFDYDDPKDPNALKLTMGNYSYDLSGGLVTHLRYIARMALASQPDPKDKRKPTEKMTALTESYLRSKLAPVPAAAVNAFSGSNVIGEPTSAKEEALNLLSPIMLDNFREASKAEGLPGIIKTSPEFFGISVTRFKGVEELRDKISEEQKTLQSAKTEEERQEASRRIKAWQKLIAREKKRKTEQHAQPQY